MNYSFKIIFISPKSAENRCALFAGSNKWRGIARLPLSRAISLFAALVAIGQAHGQNTNDSSTLKEQIRAIENRMEAHIVEIKRLPSPIQSTADPYEAPAIVDKDFFVIEQLPQVNASNNKFQVHDPQRLFKFGSQVARCKNSFGEEVLLVASETKLKIYKGFRIPVYEVNNWFKYDLENTNKESTKDDSGNETVKSNIETIRRKAYIEVPRSSLTARREYLRLQSKLDELNKKLAR